ncbi:hypothetical protein [Streptomyces sp. WAC00303]|uniref:hypothetical protein n=1 Tax=Streptomyces sp. WAC00303 TaxID=2933779 RepID=UPI0020606C18|nr:hypothetical protein [Streptomyces sp. WAC00303]UPT46131.1 hypothetical protein MWG59_34950 [Streptomyces sp. WAC00303]
MSAFIALTESALHGLQVGEPPIASIQWPATARRGVARVLREVAAEYTTAGRPHG